MQKIVLALLAVLAGAAQAQMPLMTYQQRLAMFRETPAELANAQVVLTRYRLRMQGRYADALKYLSPSFAEHMTPARMPKGPQTPYERQAAQVAKYGNHGPQDLPDLAGIQARASQDLVTLFHPHGCDIFRVQNGQITDHWDCTPWQPFSTVGELQNLQTDQAKQNARR